MESGTDFEAFVAQRRRPLMRFATVLTGRPWLADELVTDVLGRVFEKWSRIGGLDQPNAYVRRMIVNDYLSWRRRLARTLPRADLEPLMDDRNGPDAAVEHAERDAMLQRLARLPRRQRAAVVLRYYVGMADGEIAAELGCRETTVRSQISRALAALRIDLESNSSPLPAVASTANRTTAEPT